MSQKSSRVGASAAPSWRSGPIEAIVVPASRGADALDGAVRLASRTGTLLVALCSQQTGADEVAERYARRADLHRILAIDVPRGYRHDLLPTRTVAERFRAAGDHRTSDLGLKRNLGLLMARLQSWGKIVFLDDDIGVSRPPTSGDGAGRSSPARRSA